LVDALAGSRATWKVVASDMPLGLVVADGPLIEAVANRQPGAPLAREAEIAWVLGELNRRGVEDVVWITTDVHYTAAHHYAPEHAGFRDFRPFWEFVSGPLNAGGFGAVPLDPTFGPETRFLRVPPRAGASPLEGFQNFGEMNIDAATRELRVDLRDSSGESLWSVTLSPQAR
ncbi:MAG: alkaline phosphatase D family protein, partial [Stackebrandtia sp.]